MFVSVVALLKPRLKPESGALPTAKETERSLHSSWVGRVGWGGFLAGRGGHVHVWSSTRILK